MAKREPLLTEEQFIAAHKERDQKLLNYLISKRGWKIRPEIFEKVLERTASQLFAANSRVRIAFAVEVKRRLEASLKDDPERKFGFATFAPCNWAISLSLADNFDHEKFRRRATRILGDFDHIGAIDLAFYGNVSIMFSGDEPVVAPHVHALTWGHDESEIANLAERLNRTTRALLPGMLPFHYHFLTADEALARVTYMLKAPLSEYRAIAKKGARIHPVTRKIIGGHKGSFDQKKRALRPGASWKMVSVLSARSMPDLMFAGGEGVALMKRSIAKAVKRIHEEDMQRREQQIRRRLPTFA